jgi:CheY-like chemotaxis protein
MAPEVRQRLFVEPFFSTKPRNRGLGLTAVYGILRSNAGGLRLAADPAGGTRAFLLLPRADLPPTPQSAALRSALRAPRSALEKILVVDDDPMILDLVCTTLGQAGYAVEGAVDPVEALERYTAAEAAFDLVLSDLIMPRMTGADLARRLLRVDNSVNVLFMSAHVSSDFAHEDFARRGFDLLCKPFRPEGLVRAVRTALSRCGSRSGEAGPGVSWVTPATSD